MSSGQVEFNFQVPSNHAFLNKGHLPTAVEVLAQFPSHQSILVLDFALRADGLVPEPIFDQKSRFVAHKYVPGNGQVLFNIDHHNDLASVVPNFSTTHQVNSMVREGLLLPDEESQIAVVNHDDMDSVAALLLATHPNVPKWLVSLFCRAAEAADHTGENYLLVDLVDTFFGTTDLDTVVPLVNALVNQNELVFPNPESRAKYEKYKALPRIIRDLIEAVWYKRSSPHGIGSFHRETGILALQPNDKSIDTIRTLPVVKQMSLPVSIIMTSALLDSSEDRWKISLREGPSFPDGTNLAELASRLNLERYGYGGRAHAGGIGRHRGQETINPGKMINLFEEVLTDL